MEKQLPKDWKWVKLGDVGKIISGGTPSTALQEYWNGNINWISPSDLTGYRSKSIIKGAKSITETGLKNSSARLMPKGSVLFSSRAPIGYVVIAADELCTNQGFKSIIPNENLNSEFLYYYLKGAKNKAEKVASGTTFKEISLTNFSGLDFPLPPLPTQLAIVSKIEELFSELDKGIENLRTAQLQLKTYRQAVLKWAFEGRLTDNLNHDALDAYDENALSMAAEPTVTYKAKNNNGSDKGDLPDGWKWVKSGDFFDFVTSGSRGWAKYYSEKGAIFIRITNLDFDSLELDLDESKIQYVNPPTSSEGIRTKVQEGDFLFSITGYLGMLAIAPKLENAYVNQHVCLCRPKANFNRKYLGYWIISKSGGHHYLNKNQKGAVKAGLNLDDLKTFPVPVCTIAEQNRVVQEIESRLSVADKMEESITQSMQQAEALRQSILKRAFEGKLI